MDQCFKEANTLSKKGFKKKRSKHRVLDRMMVMGIPKVKTLGDEVGPLKKSLCDDLTLPKGSLLSLRDLRKTCTRPNVL